VADLEAFLPPDKAAAALTTLDVDRDGKVSLHDMREAVLQVGALRCIC
jgi:Ca2+-binding EF-hand superfamily protein